MILTREIARSHYPTIDLGRAAEFLDSRRRPITASQREEGEIPYYGANGVQGYVKDFLFDEPLILLAEDGGHFDDPSRGIAYEISGRSWVNNHAHVLKAKKGVHQRYLLWVLKHYDVTPFITGTTRAKLTKGQAENIPIPLPATEHEQGRIAAMLDKADAIRRKRKQAIALADEFLRSAYLHLVGMKHPDFPGWNPATIDSLAENKRGSIRSGPFGSALLHSEFVNEGVAVLGIDNAVRNKFEWAERRFITREKYEDLRRYRVYPNDVIITIMGTTGRSAVVPDDIPEAITTKHLASITCDLAKVLPEFLSFAIHSDPVVIDQIRAANKGAIMDGLNLGIIRQIKIRMPPISQQRLFAELLKKNYSAIRKMTTPAGDGSDLFASLSQRAFRGEL